MTRRLPQPIFQHVTLLGRHSVHSVQAALAQGIRVGDLTMRYGWECRISCTFAHPVCPAALPMTDGLMVTPV